MAKKDSQIFDSPRSISTSDALAAPPCGFWKSISFWHCLQLVDSLVFGGCNRILPIVAFTDYFLPRGPENPPAGDYELLQVWLTVTSILLVTAPAVYILVAIIREVFCKQRTADIWFLDIWARIFMCYSAAWLPAMQVYTLLKCSPSDQQGSTFVAVIPYTLVLTALLVVQAVVVLFHPTFRAIFRVFLRKFVKL